MISLHLSFDRYQIAVLAITLRTFLSKRLPAVTFHELKVISSLLVTLGATSCSSFLVKLV